VPQPINQGIIKALKKCCRCLVLRLLHRLDVKWTQQQTVLAWCCDNASDDMELSYLKNHRSFMKTECSANGQDDDRRE